MTGPAWPLKTRTQARADIAVEVAKAFAHVSFGHVLNEGCQFNARGKKTLAKRLTKCAIHEFWVLIEELEILAKIENQELVFVAADAEQVGR